MTLKNSLESKGQSLLEYFILFSVIAAITLISTSRFLPQIQSSKESLFNNVSGRIIDADKK